MAFEIFKHEDRRAHSKIKPVLIKMQIGELAVFTTVKRGSIGVQAKLLGIKVTVMKVHNGFVVKRLK